MTEIKVFKDNEKLDEVYELIVEKMNAICNQYQLNFYELFGILECFRYDLFNQLNEEDL